MKNYWLKKEEYPGFPQDDLNSLMQGCGTACLDLYYHHQFMQNETLAVSPVQTPGKTIFLVERTPILAGSMAATLTLNNKKFTFCVHETGVFTFTGIGHEDYTDIAGAFLNLNTGELVFDWNCTSAPEIIASYEYEYGSKYFS